MTGDVTHLALAVFVFIATHMLLSHPLRAALVGVLGEGLFRIVYSAIAFAALVWIVFAYRDAPIIVWWSLPPLTIWIVHLLMLLAVTLMVGSFVSPNPFLKLFGPGLAGEQPVKGVFIITRHPLMWSFAIWGVAHASIAGHAAMVILGLGIASLALVGSLAQDQKLARRYGASWAGFAVKTSYFPFVAIIGAKQKITALGWLIPILGVAFYALFVWLHPILFGVNILP